MSAGFHTSHRSELAWQDDIDILSLGNGVRVKVLHRDPESEHTDMLVKFPPGYVEPRHTHAATHSVVVLEGVQVVEGEELRPGDYLWADGTEPHGPFEYPEGCVVFASFRGPSSQHQYPGSPAGEGELRATDQPD
jgi:anti-sigma factor ChrR (cupin superfamily)